MMNPVAFLIYKLLDIYVYVIIAAVIVSWLLAFNVINYHNNFVRSLLRILSALTDPVFRPIRKIIPPMGGLDLTPLVVLFIIMGIQYTMTWGPVLAAGW